MPMATVLFKNGYAVTPVKVKSPNNRKNESYIAYEKVTEKALPVEDVQDMTCGQTEPINYSITEDEQYGR